MLRVLDDCSGTRPGVVHITGCEVALEFRGEAMTRADWTTHDYNVHFSCGLENVSEDTLAVNLAVNGGQFDQLPPITPLLYASNLPDSGFEPFVGLARTDLGKRYAVKITLQPGERVYLANTLVRSFVEMKQRFDALSKLGPASRHVFGHSVLGRELVAYTYGDAERQGCLLVTSGFHPPEPDTIATDAIMSWLVSPAGLHLTNRLAVVVVPLMNPDGYSLGTQGANANGINFYWHFARELPDLCPEAAALWRLADTLAPRGYIDFHSYTFQLQKDAGPYVRPLIFYSSAWAKRAAKTFYADLARKMHTKPVRGFSTYAPHTLGSMLADKYDTITAAKYHLHLKEGLVACGAHGLQVLQLLAGALLSEGMSGRAQPRKRGAMDLLRLGRRLWAGLLRPQFGLIRRGHLTKLRFDRVGRDLPLS